MGQKKSGRFFEKKLRKKLLRLAGCCIVPLLAGCNVGPNFTPPAPPSIAHWHNHGAAVTEASNPDPLWWNQFGDPALTALMQQAIANNPSLQEAMLRVVAARQNVITAGAAGLPTLSGNASYMREELGLKGILEDKGAYSELNELADADSPVNQAVPGLGSKIDDAGTGLLNQLAAPTNLYQYGFSSSWELDLFGQVRRSVEEAKASAQAQAEAGNDALVMLESQVAEQYLALRAAQAAGLTQNAQIAAARQSLQLTQSRYSRGLTSDLDVQQAETQLFSEESQAEDYEKQIAQALDALNTLAGVAPGTLDAALITPAPLPAVPALIGVGLPSSLARRRPDVREAEDQLHAATAGVGVAVASFYPSITLTGSVGLRALDASYLTNWASLFYSAGPGITLPIFEGGRLSANLRMARAEQASAALNYRATVLNALREVEDALVAYRMDAAARDATAASVQSAGLSLYLSNNLYTHGLASYLQVLDAQRTSLSEQQQLVQANAALADDVVTLYTALGGGWQGTAMRQASVPATPPPVPAALDSVAGQ